MRSPRYLLQGMSISPTGIAVMGVVLHVEFVLDLADLFLVSESTVCV